MELSSVDSDKEDSDQQDTDQEEEEESEEESEKDKIDHSLYSSICYGSSESLLLRSNVDRHQKHTTEFRLGIILPPPELT